MYYNKTLEEEKMCLENRPERNRPSGDNFRQIVQNNLKI